PTAIMVGTGRGARNGILIKGGESLERLRLVDEIVLDKTGTITEGLPSVTQVIPLGRYGEQMGEVVRLAGLAEHGSEHPLARAVVRYAAEQGFDGGQPAPAMMTNSAPVESDAVTGFRAIAGGGVTASIEGHEVVIGNSRLLAERGLALDDVRPDIEALEINGQTVMVVAIDGELAALIAAADTIKAGSAEAVRVLRDHGLQVTMLTGDNPRIAEAIAREVGIDRVVANVRPEDKAAEVALLRREGKVVAMVGDGINDAPALAQADAGIAMGTGTDVAMETADMTLVRGDLRSLPLAIAIARDTARVIRQNLFWAFFYNVVLIPLAMFGKINPIFAAAAMALSSVTVVSNSLRLRGTRGATIIAASVFAIAIALVGGSVLSNL
ncbi:MAG: heavy metal translocating P-type ATPase, partial [Chloroflexota bacterium]|nr:heavy metal translocating P-type ATPase [Chloroflexota bacterium]